MAYLSYIIEPSSSRAEELVEALSSVDIQAQVFSSIAALRESARHFLPDVLILNECLARENPGQLSDLFSQVPALLYGDDLADTNHMTYYDIGARKVLHLNGNGYDELTAASRMILFRLNHLRRHRRNSLTNGSLETFSLADIVNNALKAGKNLIILVKCGLWEAKIRIFEGHVLQVQGTGNLSPVDTLMKAMWLPSGSFQIRRYRKLEEQGEIAASTLALLAEYRLLQDEISAFLEKYFEGEENPVLQLTVDGDAAEESALLGVIRRQRFFRDILLYSPLALRKSLQILASLLDRQKLAAKKQAANFFSFTAEDIAYLRYQVIPPDCERPVMVIIGPKSERQALMRHMAVAENRPLRSRNEIDITRMRVSADLEVALFGIPVADIAFDILAQLPHKPVAGIFLISREDGENFEYASYLLKRLTKAHPIPFVVGAVNQEPARSIAMARLREEFVLPEPLDMVLLQEYSLSEIRQLLLRLRKPKTEGDGADV